MTAGDCQSLKLWRIDPGINGDVLTISPRYTQQPDVSGSSYHKNNTMEFKVVACLG